jgi:hypothetical protein
MSSKRICWLPYGRYLIVRADLEFVPEREFSLLAGKRRFVRIRLGADLCRCVTTFVMAGCPGAENISKKHLTWLCSLGYKHFPVAIHQGRRHLK